MSGVSKPGEESVPGRGTSSAKALKRENRAHGFGEAPVPGAQRSVGPDGEGLIKRHAKVSAVYA